MVEAIGIVLGILGLLFAFEKPRRAFLGLFPTQGVAKSVQPASADWIARLNAEFPDEVHVYCQTYREPVLHLEGEYRLSAAQKADATKQREVLKRKGHPNDMHAILIEEPNWLSEPVNMRLKTIDYAGIVALRNEGGKPQVLSAGALVVSRELGKILLHRRGTAVAKYCSHLHTFGGGYMPPSSHGRDDGESLRATAEREVLEETKLALPPDGAPPMILAKEIATGFIQFIYLGFDVPASAVSRVTSNWEGHAEAVAFSGLPELLQASDWTPSGKVHVLSWLALGAPGCGPNPRFGTLTPDQLFNNWVGATAAGPAGSAPQREARHGRTQGAVDTPS